MISEYDFPSVKDSHPMIGEELLSNLYVVPVVTPERRVDVDPLPYLPEEL